jgi:hypothetical protein
MEVTRCAGPTAGCRLLRGEDHCELLDAAGLALYHEAVLTDRFVARLSSIRTPAMTVATHDRHRGDGGHEPAMSHVLTSSDT